MATDKALLAVDVQRDFCPGGELAVPQGDTIVSILNQYIDQFLEKRLSVFVSRDWHPENTSHFKQNGGDWPVHCVQNTPGALFHPKFKVSPHTIILSKGIEPDQEGYSVFEGKDPAGKSFDELLKQFGIKELYVGGLATDFCVKFTVLEALKKGYKVFLLMDATRGIDDPKGSVDKAVTEMVDAGAAKMTFEDLPFDTDEKKEASAEPAEPAEDDQSPEKKEESSSEPEQS